jgi:hypothetical protein
MNSTTFARCGLGLLVLSVSLAGCAAFFDIVQPNRTVVRLVNNGAFPVRVELFISDEQDIPEDLLTADSDDREVFTVGPGGVESFSMDCDGLQAIIIDEADLQLVGQVGPETGTDVLRDGDDFGCGDTINFIFDHSELIVDFDVEVVVEQQID